MHACRYHHYLFLLPDGLGERATPPSGQASCKIRAYAETGAFAYTPNGTYAYSMVWMSGGY